MLVLAKTVRRALAGVPRFLWLDMEKLYCFTRDSTAELRPWMCDENGVAVVLDARYAFTDLYLERNGRLDDRDTQRTRYWQYITAPLSAHPRDGGATWQYSDPQLQVQRFMVLIRSLREHGYRWRDTRFLNRFEQEAAPHCERNSAGAEQQVNYIGRRWAGVLSVVRHGSYYSVLNGLHRLAVLKYLRDHGGLVPGRVLTVRVG